MDAIKSGEVKKEGDKKKREKERKKSESRKEKRREREISREGKMWPCKTAQHSIRFKLAFTQPRK